MKPDHNQGSTSIYAPGQQAEEYASQFCAFLVRYDHFSVNAGQLEGQEEVVGFSSPGIRRSALLAGETCRSVFSALQGWQNAYDTQDNGEQYFQ